MPIIICGNEEYEPDSLPVRLLPKLRRAMPGLELLHLDPNEDWDVSGEVTLIDTVINATEPMIFDSLDKFESSPRVSMHDFDALANLRLLSKLGRVTSIQIIGLPPLMDEDAAVEFVTGSRKLKAESKKLKR